MPLWKKENRIFQNFRNFHKHTGKVKTLWINGKNYLPDQVITGSYGQSDPGSFERKVLDFIHNWKREDLSFFFKTSGSTGKPKTIEVSREKMLTSAQSTMNFLNLRAGGCLLCLDPDFIAGAMMIVRALIRNMHIYAVNPSSNPFKEFPPDIEIDLCALVPLQLHEILQDDSSGKHLNKVSNVLIGGSDLSPDLINRLQLFSNHIYHTFGMTETVSHIALRKISGETPDEYFQALPGISLDTDERGCLVISGKITGKTPLITNDRVDLINESQFRWLGRIDHIINTGSFKVLIEPLENKIGSILKKKHLYRPFFIAGVPDDKLGQKIAIIFETNDPDPKKIQLREKLENELHTYEIPREWRIIPNFIRTATQKIDRNRSLKSSRKIG